MQATVKFVLREGKNEEKHIALRIIFQRKAVYLHTKHQILPKYWDEQAGTPKPNYPKYKGLLEDLTGMWTKVVRMLNDGTHPSVVVKSLKQPVMSAPAVDIPLIPYMQKLVKDCKQAGRVKYAIPFQNVLGHLQAYKGNKLTFNQVDLKFLQNFESYLLQKGLSMVSVSVYLRALRTVCNMAIKEKLISKDWYPFAAFSLAKYTKLKTPKRAITREELDRLEAYIPQTNKEELAQNVFLFSFYCRGINFRDIAHLTKDNIQGDRLLYVRSKTKDQFSIKLLEPARAILDYYMTKSKHKGKFIFPILLDNTNPITVVNKLNHWNKKLNKTLQDIAQKIGIEAHITTYVARHSFATILYKKGVRVSMISEMLGHETEEITRVYLKSFGNEELDDAVEKLL